MRDVCRCGVDEEPGGGRERGDVVCKGARWPFLSDYVELPSRCEADVEIHLCAHMGHGDMRSSSAKFREGALQDRTRVLLVEWD